MMTTLDHLTAAVQSDLDATLQLIEDSIVSNIALAKDIAQYLLAGGGKRIRPILVLLSAKACGYTGKQHLELAAIVELLHTATLLHDDVIDESGLRRGRPTANAEWGNEACVLVGDLLYARAFQLIAALDHPRIIKTIAHATSLIVEGEVLQLMHCHDATTTEQTYLDIIQRKTGKLFEVASVAGPLLNQSPEPQVQALQVYGKSLGMAFQLLDDALDYTGNPEKIGKNLGDDLQEGKPTLPLIYCLKHGNDAQKTLISSAIKHPEQADICAIQKALQDTKAITYTQQKAQAQIDQAIKALDILKDSPEKQHLISLAMFCLEREC
jgi:octaprenyl-diphosphate synthase